MAFDPHETKASKAARAIIPSLRILAIDAQAEALKDQAASRCFGLHRWSWWEPLEGSELNWQTRRCLKCGRIQDKRR